MNLKIDETGLRFRISAEELEILQSGEMLKTALPIGRRQLIVCIDPVGPGDELVAIYDEDTIRLLVSAAKIAELAAMGKSREGLEQQRDGLVVSLQVDFRTQKRQSS